MEIFCEVWPTHAKPYSTLRFRYGSWGEEVSPLPLALRSLLGLVGSVPERGPEDSPLDQVECIVMHIGVAGTPHLAG